MMKLNVRIHPAGAALLGACLMLAPSQVALSAVAALAWHEAAHVGAMALCGVKECTVELTPFGGMADAACYDRLSPGRKAASALAGVAASALGAWLCLRFAPDTPFWHALYLSNASLSAFNLLPVWPLDGARALLAGAERMGVERPVQKLLTFLAYALSAFMVALGLWGAWMGHVNFSLLLAGPYLAYTAHACSVAQSVRSVQRAQDAKRKLAGGFAMPVRTFACAGPPSALTLARLAGRLSEMRYHMLLIIDPADGQVRESLTEHELAQRLFEGRR